MEENKLLKELEIGFKEVEEYKADYKKKEEMWPDDTSYRYAVSIIENTENHIKRAIARALFPEKVQELQYWIGCLCEAYRCDNRITWNAIAEQVIYEMFKGTGKALTELGGNDHEQNYQGNT